jgi:hypothetical protein
MVRRWSFGKWSFRGEIAGQISDIRYREAVCGGAAWVAPFLVFWGKKRKRLATEVTEESARRSRRDGSERGRVGDGGEGLTPEGVSYRDEALSWS